ncbi:6193_t:CDS:1, partial [Gigaspora rosea]
MNVEDTNLNANKKNTKLVENEASHAYDHDNEQKKKPVETDEEQELHLDSG